MTTTGKLYIVSTPIGNLSDITLRAVEILKSVDGVLSEDTRETDKIFKNYDIKAKQYSYRDQNHNKMISFIVELLSSGQDLALVSDSGTPLISDPGYKLVREVIKRGFETEMIPGPSAVISALVISGLPTDKFVFLGFLPKSRSQREKILKKYGDLDATLTIYESPYRVERLLTEINEILGNRYISVSKDLTKKFELTKRGFVQDLIKEFKDQNKGEFVICISKSNFSPE